MYNWVYCDCYCGFSCVCISDYDESLYKCVYGHYDNCMYYGCRFKKTPGAARFDQAIGRDNSADDEAILSSNKTGNKKNVQDEYLYQPELDLEYVDPGNIYDPY